MMSWKQYWYPETMEFMSFGKWFHFWNKNNLLFGNHEHCNNKLSTDKWTERWWILSVVMKCERWSDQHDTSVEQRKKFCRELRFFLCPMLVSCWSIHLSNSPLLHIFLLSNIKIICRCKTWEQEAPSSKLTGLSHHFTDVSMLSRRQTNERIRFKLLVGETVALKPM